VRVDRLQTKIGIAPPVLTYSSISRKVFVVDRSFLFYRRYGAPAWPWAEGEAQFTNDLAEAEPLSSIRPPPWGGPTGTDELLRLGLDADGRVTSEEIVWRAESDERADRHHVNDVAVVGCQLLVSNTRPAYLASRRRAHSLLSPKPPNRVPKPRFLIGGHTL
jgi:hypothetical protein